MPISPSRRASRNTVESPTESRKAGETVVSAQDRKLAVLYWKLQKQVHTDPGIRDYLFALTRIMKRRHIQPTALNNIGLELAGQEKL